MLNIEIENRPVLIDRIQVNVTPNFKQLFDFHIEVKGNSTLKGWILKNEFENYKDLIIKNRKLKILPYKQYRDKKNNFHYNIIIDSDIPYISDIKVSAFPPFSVSFKINFIRLLRDKIKEKWELNGCYDKLIFLDEDNYICPKTWPEWDYNLISSIINELNDLCIKIADNSLYQIIPFHNIKYEKVTVKQIETNIDFYTGNNNSLFLINNLLKTYSTKEGMDFRKKIGEVALKNRIPFEELSKDPTTINKNESVSIQFQICKALYFKIYRKTSDHIRAELTFESNYLKNKFSKYDIDNGLSNSTDIKRIIKPVLEFSKTYFKDINFVGYLEALISNPKDLFVLDYINPVYNLLKDFNPVLWDLICCVKNNHPITNMKTKKLIQKNRKIAQHFKRVYMGNKGYVYVLRDKRIYKKLEKVLTRDEILVGNRRPLFAWEKKHFEKKPVEYWKRPIPYNIKGAVESANV